MFKGYNAPKTDAAPSPFAPVEPAPAPQWGTPDAAPAEGAFYGQTEEVSSSPFDAAAVAAAPAVTRNVLNSDVSIVGTLRFTDDLLVDGSVEGEIESEGVLTVGSNASIQAGEKNKVAIRTKSAIIHGRVVGDIVVTDRVELAGTAELVGDITAARIAIQEGAIFVGHCSVGAPAAAPVATPAKKSTKSAKSAAAADSDLLLG